MKAFEYVAPASTDDAIQALAGSDNAAALAGGTDLVNRMKDYVTSPRRVVYLKGIASLGEARKEGDALALGANLTLAQIVAHEALAEAFPAIRQATLEVGTPQIRNMATLGGNLLQRPRCWYFRNGFGLVGGENQGKSLVQQLEGDFAPRNFAVPEDAHLLRDGDNRYASIFMTDGDALFASPSSLAPPLIALGASAVINGPKGARTVPVEQLYQVPKTSADRELTLAAGEVLTAVHVPLRGLKNATYEVRWKQSHDWPLVLVSAALEMEGETVKSGRIVLGGVAPVPFSSEEAVAAIAGKAITRETALAAGAAAVQAAKPLSMNAYKVQLTKVAVARALLAVAGQRYWEA
jgi:xanthine dehydrogenase YagS FAD-binding subunit